MVIRIENISKKTTPEDLKSVISPLGEVRNLVFKGSIALVQLASKMAARTVLYKLHGMELHGSELKVKACINPSRSKVGCTGQLGSVRLL